MAGTVGWSIGTPFRQLQFALHHGNFWKYFSKRR
jgi:hypothetical protein